MGETKLTKFDYLLNSFEQASQADEPHKLNYADKRKALFAYVRPLEAASSLPASPAPREIKVTLPYIAEKLRQIARIERIIEDEELQFELESLANHVEALEARAGDQGESAKTSRATEEG